MGCLCLENRAEEQDEQWNEVLLNLDQMPYEQLREVYAKLNDAERRVSYKRRILHGRIDIVKAEMMKKIKQDYRSSTVSPDKLAEILAKGVVGRKPSTDVTEEPLF